LLRCNANALLRLTFNTLWVKYQGPVGKASRQ